MASSSRLAREDFDDVAADAESTAREVDVVALVEHGDELGEEVVAVELLALADGEHLKEVLGRAETVDAGDTGDDEDVAAGEERTTVERRRRSISSLMEESFSM